MGIKPPKGVILYGSPGTGKTLLAKAVANQTSATFFRVVGSELIQKYLGDGPKMVRELFRVAEEHAPVLIYFKLLIFFSRLFLLMKSMRLEQNVMIQIRAVSAKFNVLCLNCSIN